MCGGTFGTIFRVGAGIATGGLSEVSRATGMPLDPFSQVKTVVDVVRGPRTDNSSSFQNIVGATQKQNKTPNPDVQAVLKKRKTRARSLATPRPTLLSSPTGIDNPNTNPSDSSLLKSRR